MVFLTWFFSRNNFLIVYLKQLSNVFTGQRENTVTVKSSNNVRQGTGADPNKPPCKKAKLLRLEKKQQKLLQRGMSLEKLNVDPQQKTLEQFLNEISENSKHKLRVS